MPLGDHLRELIEALSELVAQHIRLARVELKEDARELGKQLGKIAGFAPLILVGYGFLCVALALFLRRFLADDLAFLLVGVINLAVGGLGIYFAAHRLKGRTVMSETLKQMETTAVVLKGERG